MRALLGASKMMFLIPLLLWVLSLPQPSIADDDGNQMEQELPRRLAIVEAQRKAEALLGIAVSDDRKKKVRSTFPSFECPRGSKIKWSYSGKLYARYGTTFASRPYAPTNCHQDEFDANKCPPSGPKTWTEYAPTLLEITTEIPKPSANANNLPKDDQSNEGSTACEIRFTLVGGGYVFAPVEDIALTVFEGD